MRSRCRADVNDPVRVPDNVEIVFDNEQRIAGRFQPIERAQQRFGVRGMKASRRLVQNVNHAEQVRAHLRGEPQPLQLTGGQRGRAALEGQIPEAEVQQYGEPRLQILRDAARDDCPLRMFSVERPPW